MLREAADTSSSKTSRSATSPTTPLIEDLNVVVEPGETVAIVGPTGAGKTTLVNLLMRFYDVDGGRITVDGNDVRELTRDNLREHVRHGAAGHLAVRRHHPREHRLRTRGRHRGADPGGGRAAQVDHFVRTLEHGYDTAIDDEAANVSQGQRQLLTIARAFLADPRILILDEATSSVDTRTEVLIQQAMARLMHGRTWFVIAHRLSTIRDADRSWS